MSAADDAADRNAIFDALARGEDALSVGGDDTTRLADELCALVAAAVARERGAIVAYVRYWADHKHPPDDDEDEDDEDDAIAAAALRDIAGDIEEVCYGADDFARAARGGGCDGAEPDDDDDDDAGAALEEE